MADYERIKQMAMDVTAMATDDGRLVDIGWQAFARLFKLTPNVAPYDLVRLAYLAGAEHLYASILGVLDPEDEPTDQDMRRMRLIHEEIEMAKIELIKAVEGK